MTDTGRFLSLGITIICRNHMGELPHFLVEFFCFFGQASPLTLPQLLRSMYSKDWRLFKFFPRFTEIFFGLVYQVQGF